MKIEWLNDERTEAVVTRQHGLWWWKRFEQTRVYRHRGIHDDIWAWRFRSSEKMVVDYERELARTLEHEHSEAKRDRHWTPVTRIPPARLVERKS